MLSPANERITRRAYLLWLLVSGLSFFFVRGIPEPGLWFLLPPLLVVLISVGRLHDADKDGRWAALMVIPPLGVALLLYLLVIPGTRGENPHGPDPREIAGLPLPGEKSDTYRAPPGLSERPVPPAHGAPPQGAPARGA